MSRLPSLRQPLDLEVLSSPAGGAPLRRVSPAIEPYREDPIPAPAAFDRPRPASGIMNAAQGFQAAQGYPAGKIPAPGRWFAAVIQHVCNGPDETLVQVFLTEAEAWDTCSRFRDEWIDTNGCGKVELGELEEHFDEHYACWVVPAWVQGFPKSEAFEELSTCLRETC